MPYVTRVPVSIVFETHATTLDNERGRATGWLPGELSDRRPGAGPRARPARGSDDRVAVFTSDLARADADRRRWPSGTALPVLADWRLRECDYGEWNGAGPRASSWATGCAHLDQPYPGGESWRQAIDPGGRVPGRPAHAAGPDGACWSSGTSPPVTALEVALAGRPLAQLLDEEFVWQQGWEYELPDPAAR